MAGILQRYAIGPVLVVVSAIGKTTNAIEEVLENYLANDPLAVLDSFQKVSEYHFAILDSLFPDKSHPVYGEVTSLFDQLASLFANQAWPGF